MRYQASVEWSRVAGDGDEDDGDEVSDKTGNAAPATADVAFAGSSAAVSWSVTIDGVPIDVTIRAHGDTKTRSTSVAAAVARQLQLAARVRAASHPNEAVRTVLRALVPSQAQAAVKAASAVVGLVRSGRLSSMLHRLKGGARVIGRALLEANR